MFNSNLGAIFYCFQDMASFLLESTFFLPFSPSFNHKFDSVSVALYSQNFVR